MFNEFVVVCEETLDNCKNALNLAGYRETLGLLISACQDRLAQCDKFEKERQIEFPICKRCAVYMHWSESGYKCPYCGAKNG